MPLMDLTYPAGALSAATLDGLTEELTTVLLRAERAPDTDLFRTITWLHVHELPPDAVRAAGRPVAEPVFRLDVTVPYGTLSDRRKQELVAEATRGISGAAGLGGADALRIWVMIHEVPDGNWGAGGQVIRFEQLRQMAATQRDQAAGPPRTRASRRRSHERVAIDRLHPVRVQLRDRGRGQDAEADPGRQTPPGLAGLHV
jgi:phenylpyruvate tautomerase PptA (4-oxalocrotonate tautomerase family)